MDAVEICLRSNSPASLSKIEGLKDTVPEIASRRVHPIDALLKHKANVEAIEQAAEGIAKVYSLTSSVTDLLVC